MSFKLSRLLLFFLCCVTPLLAHARYTPEQVKAVYIYRIASFIHWDDEQDKQQINLCVPDNHDIRGILYDITRGKRVREMTFSLVDQDCDLMFISRSETMSRIDGQSSQTVYIGDIERFSEKGGAIELKLNNGRIKPKVNLSNVGEYSISSNFLRVAEVVGEDE